MFYETKPTGSRPEIDKLETASDVVMIVFDERTARHDIGYGKISTLVAD